MPPLIAAVAVGIGVSVGVATTIVVVGAVLLTAALVIGASLLFKPKVPLNQASINRLTQALNVSAFRVIVFGNTVMGNDERYWEVYGSTGYDQIIACATHKVYAMDQFFISGLPVTFSGSAATGTLAVGTVGTAGYQPATTQYSGGVLTKDNQLVGVHGSTIAGTTGAGSLWTSAASFTGCAYYRLKWNVTQKGLPGGIPTQTVQVGRGAYVYDPRRDSTNGGSGSHRPNDNTTWEYAPLDSNGVAIGRNNALQMLWYLLGWSTINPSTGLPVPVAGRGVDPNDIDFASFIVAANTCEVEGYYTDGALSTGDSHTTNEGIIAAGAGGLLIDPGGLWSYYVATNDTASIAVALTDDDIVSGVTWNPKDTIANLYNQCGGNFVDPSATSMYQPQPYPLVTNATYLSQDGGTPKTLQLDFSNVQSAAQAQKLARIALNKNRLTGTFTATFKYTALQAKNFNCVTLSFASLGWVNKLFRVVSQAINPIGGIDMTLQEEAAAVYTGGTVNTYVPVASGQVYSQFQQIPLAGLAAVQTTSIGANGTSIDVLSISWTPVAENVDKIEVYIAPHGTTNWSLVGAIRHDVSSILTGSLQPGTQYDVEARAISINQVPGAYASVTATTGDTTVMPGLPIGTNVLVDTEFQRGTSFWYLNGNTMGGSPSVHINYIDAGPTNYFNPTQNVLYGENILTPTLGTYFQIRPVDNVGSTISGLLPGGKLFASAMLATYRVTGYIGVDWLAADGSYAGGGGTFATQAVMNTGGINWAAPVYNSGFLTVPADGALAKNVRAAAFFFSAQSDGNPNPFIFIGSPMLARVLPGQTVPLVYQPGRTDYNADQTSANTAQGINNQAPAATDHTIQPGSTQNQTYYQPNDPALSFVVADGAVWHDTSVAQLKMRISGAWVIVANLGTIAAGAVIFDSVTHGSYSFTIPATSTGHVDIEIWGGGGGGGFTHGGGGSGYSIDANFAVTPGTTVISGTVGSAGLGRQTSPAVTATNGGATTVTSPAMSALGGGNGQSAAGAAGTASGGTTNTTGEAGDTGGAGNGGANLGASGGARQTTAGSFGNLPGGGSSGGGGGDAGNGAVGRVRITAR